MLLPCKNLHVSKNDLHPLWHNNSWAIIWVTFCVHWLDIPSYTVSAILYQTYCLNCPVQFVYIGVIIKACAIVGDMTWGTKNLKYMCSLWMRKFFPINHTHHTCLYGLLRCISLVKVTFFFVFFCYFMFINNHTQDCVIHLLYFLILSKLLKKFINFLLSLLGFFRIVRLFVLCVII